MSTDNAGERLREAACVVMHDAYEIAALRNGWETQERSRKTWAEVPEANKATMRTAVGALLDWLAEHPATPAEVEECSNVAPHRHPAECVTFTPSAEPDARTDGFVRGPVAEPDAGDADGLTEAEELCSRRRLAEAALADYVEAGGVVADLIPEDASWRHGYMAALAERDVERPTTPVEVVHFPDLSSALCRDVEGELDPDEDAVTCPKCRLYLAPIRDRMTDEDLAEWSFLSELPENDTESLGWLSSDERHAVINAVPREPGSPAIQSGDCRRLQVEVARIKREAEQRGAEKALRDAADEFADAARMTERGTAVDHVGAAFAAQRLRARADATRSTP